MAAWLHDIGEVAAVAGYIMLSAALPLLVYLLLLPETRGRPLD